MKGPFAVIVLALCVLAGACDDAGFVETTTPPTTGAPPSVESLTETIGLAGLDLEMRYPSGWFSAFGAGRLTAVAQEEADLARDISGARKGPHVLVETVPIAQLEADAGYKRADGLPGWFALNAGLFGWPEETELETIDLAGMDALRLRATGERTQIEYVHVLGIRGEVAFNMTVGIPPGYDIVEFTPLIDAVIASIAQTS